MKNERSNFYRFNKYLIGYTLSNIVNFRKFYIIKEAKMGKNQKMLKRGYKI